MPAGQRAPPLQRRHCPWQPSQGRGRNSHAVVVGMAEVVATASKAQILANEILGAAAKTLVPELALVAVVIESLQLPQRTLQ